MGRIAVGIEYDGSSYCGWQEQPGARSVQSTVEAALARIADEPVSLICAGRTDAGVHARCQVAHFETRARRAARAWLLGTNTHLPPSVALRCQIVSTFVIKRRSAACIAVPRLDPKCARL